MASDVAINVLGTVTTTSPGPTPQAIKAKRSASVPLLTATEYSTVQNSAKASSNSATIGPPINPAVCSARRKTSVSSCSSFTCGVTRSRNGIWLASDIGILSLRFDRPQSPCGVSSHDRVGWYIFGHDASGTDNRIFANAQIAKKRGSGTDRCALAHHCRPDVPISAGLQRPIDVRSPRVGVIGGGHSMPDKDVVLGGH